MVDFSTLKHAVSEVVNDCNGKEHALSFERQRLAETKSLHVNCLGEIAVGDRAVDTLAKVREMLRRSGIEECEKMATEALRAIFGFKGRVVYDLDVQRFMLERGDSRFDLCDGEGGGYVVVVSLVFQLYMICRSGGRRVLFFDEAFTQISTEYFDNFIGFLHRVCHDLNFDILLVTHDQRIEIGNVDSAYRVGDGVAEKEK